MFVGVDEVVGKFVADLIHSFFVVHFTTQEVVDAVETALTGGCRLGLEVDGLLVFLGSQLHWKVLISNIIRLGS